MKLNKTIGRVATTLVATAMLASLAAVPAFANPFTGGTSDKPISEITFTKELLLPAGSVTPTKEFKFDIKAADAGNTETINVTGGTVGVRDGEGNVSNAGTVTIDPNDTRKASGTANIDSVTDIVTLSKDKLPSGFTDAGVYKYTIEEQDVSGDDYKDATNQLYLYLVVERKSTAVTGSTNPSDYFISGATVYNGSAKGDTYTNWYKLGGGDEPSIQVGTIEVSKTVTGAMGSKNDSFTFTLSSDDNAITECKISIDGGTATAVAANGQFTLKHGQKATITGLDAGKYNVVETVDRGYTLTTIGDKTTTEVSNGVEIQAEVNETKRVTFTNDRAAVSPTGIVMNVAPYALLVVIAAAGCFVFLRKRRED